VAPAVALEGGREVGELVVTKPMPSMPIGLWNDGDGGRYRETYFDAWPGIWLHGDWITVTERGTVVVHGRSDATLNRDGVRLGSAHSGRVRAERP
jgi:acyl-coenzyme A synthetase/AMP-(fatty) acid ligase